MTFRTDRPSQVTVNTGSTVIIANMGLLSKAKSNTDNTVSFMKVK